MGSLLHPIQFTNMHIYLFDLPFLLDLDVISPPSMTRVLTCAARASLSNAWSLSSSLEKLEERLGPWPCQWIWSRTIPLDEEVDRINVAMAMK